MPLPHVDDTPQWVVQESETPWISTEQDTPVTIPQEVPLPPSQVTPSREETDASTGDSIFPHRIDWMKLHSRRQFTKMFYHRSLRLTKINL